MGKLGEQCQQLPGVIASVFGQQRLEQQRFSQTLLGVVERLQNKILREASIQVGRPLFRQVPAVVAKPCLRVKKHSSMPKTCGQESPNISQIRRAMWC